MASNAVRHDHDNALQRVPADQRKGFISIAAVAAGFCICMSGLYTGAALSAGMSLKNAIIAAVIGNIILSLFGGAVGAAGAKEGVASAMLSRHSFGMQGSKFVGALLAIVMLGWFAVQVGFFGSTMQALFPNGGFITTQYAAAAWGGILMMLTAYFGFKGLNILSYVAVPAVGILAIIGMVFAVKGAGGWAILAQVAPSEPMTIGAAIVSVVGSFAGGASAQADITRYAKTPGIAWGGTIFGYLVANTFIVFAGYVVTASSGHSDLPVAFIAMGMGALALIVLILAQWTTNDNNLYTASLGFANVFPVSKRVLVIVCGVIATIVGALGLADYFSTWLSILGTGIPPVAGIIICDYFFLRGQKYEYGKGTKYCQVNIWAFVALAIAVVVGFTVKWGIASVNSLVVAIILYFIFMKAAGNKGVGIIGETTEK
ncbi:MAG: cytosine permease [Clostridiales bacterium]|nr:cytosine permease [Clostridiales bacterium]